MIDKIYNEKIKYKKIKDKILLVDMNQSLPTF